MLIQVSGKTYCVCVYIYIYIYWCVFLTVRLSIILAIDQLNAQILIL